ncbi:histone deacetylase [Waterburya agarophytonicola K14]|uniref:Histone deacetylase n=1 Tax=Waterburya agarophytonicola KI4 TaxID=2874699 RepID=A0A964BQY2_9CYAN|nr:histone deacetylase [Waterburya agarophytonicola]MCC0177579.1 histone deacetylase [Waterburya agarophytonicola KI4]
MSKISVIYSSEFLEHDTGYGHPEKAKRLTAIAKALQEAEWSDRLEWHFPTPCQERKVLSHIQKIHTPEHIERVKKVALEGGGHLDADTVISAKSYEVALLAVSAWLDGVDRVLNYQQPTFVLARPPGHHATRNRAMGFCLFSNAAIAAEYALTKPRIERVGILDWDVHHGNGTEAIVQDNSHIAYCSLHQHPCYPGTGGNKNQRGKYNNILNLPLVEGSNIADYQLIFEEEVIPFFKNFSPDILIVSAGYDANQDDPLAGISLQPQDYSLLTKYVLQITNFPLFGLEGGYALGALAKSVVATLRTCLS